MPLLGLRRLGVAALSLVGFFHAHFCILGFGLLSTAALRATSMRFCSSAHNHARCRVRTWSGVSCVSNSSSWGINSCALMVPLFMSNAPSVFARQLKVEQAARRKATAVLDANPPQPPKAHIVPEMS